MHKTKVLSEEVAAFRARTPGEARETEVLRVAAELATDRTPNALETARRSILRWADDQAGGALPEAAWAGEKFDHLAGGRNVSGARLAHDGATLWAMRADVPDRRVAGRTWTTEAVIGAKPGARPHLGLRLIAATPERPLDIDPHAPRPVLALAGSPGLAVDGHRLRHTPERIRTDSDAAALCDHLLDPQRRLPIIVATTPEGSGSGRAPIDVRRIARAVAGMARVAVVPAPLSWTLTDRLGRAGAVFGGAARIYLPGFSSADDPHRHRLFLANGPSDAAGRRGCEMRIRKAVAETSIASTHFGKDILDFARIRTASRKQESASLRERHAPDSERLEIAEKLIDSLEAEKAEKDREIAQALDLARGAEDRATAAEQEYRALLSRLRAVERHRAQAAFEAPPAPESASPEPPTRWADFLDWMDAHYPGRVAVTPRARRMLRRPEFGDVALAARVVEWLATVARRGTATGQSLQNAVIEAGVHNARCGGDAYQTDWHGQRHTVDWHIKSGGNTRDPRRCLRVYYFHEPETQQVVIDHLPGHRTTAAT